MEARPRDCYFQAWQGSLQSFKLSPHHLLGSISKVFERIILKSLNGFISTVNILPDHQFRFMVAHSTSYQFRKVVRHVKVKRSLRACYFWMSKKRSTLFGTRVILWGIGQNWTRVHQNPWNLAIWFIIQYHKTRIFLFWRFYEFLKNFGLAQKKS
jgi:hypothetical protein